MAKKAPAAVIAPEAPRATLVLSPATWRDHIREVLAETGIGEHEARHIAREILRRVVKGHAGNEPADGRDITAPA